MKNVIVTLKNNNLLIITHHRRKPMSHEEVIEQFEKVPDTAIFPGEPSFYVPVVVYRCKYKPHYCNLLIRLADNDDLGDRCFEDGVYYRYTYNDIEYMACEDESHSLTKSALKMA